MRSESENEVARHLLSLQPALLAELTRVLEGFPQSGLYADEESEEYTFGRFIAHVQSALSESPRTVLLRALDDRLLALYDASTVAQELHSELGFCRGATISCVADAVAVLPRGEAHHAWAIAAAACAKPIAPLDLPAHRQRAVAGLRAKHASKKRDPPTEAEISSMLQRASDAAAAAASAAREREAALRDRLRTDPAWQRHERVQSLWVQSGVASLWTEFVALDTAEGRERQSRGSHFEGGRAALCFAMLVEMLQSTELPDPAAFSYRCGALWVDSRGRLLGEIDLVILYNEVRATHQRSAVLICAASAPPILLPAQALNSVRLPSTRQTVCALLEMKSGCFECAAALAQHEAKLAAAQRSVATASGRGVAASAGRGAGRGAGPFITETTAWQAPRLPLPPPDVTVPVYVATLLPPHPYVIGAEPALTRAVCDALYGRPAEQRSARASAHLEARQLEPPPPRATHDVERAVRSRMGERLQLSPLGCVRAHASRILVVEAPGMVGVEGLAEGAPACTTAREERLRRAGVTMKAAAAVPVVRAPHHGTTIALGTAAATMFCMLLIAAARSSRSAR